MLFWVQSATTQQFSRVLADLGLLIFDSGCFWCFVSVVLVEILC